MRIRTFFVISAILHMLVLAGIYRLPSFKQAKKEGFSAMLVTSQEAGIPEVYPPSPPRMPVRPGPPPSMAPKIARPSFPYVPPVMPEVRRELPSGPPSGDDQAKDKGTADPGAIRSGPLDDKKKEGLSAGKPDTKPGIGSGRQGLSGRARLFDPGVTASIAEKDISASLKESDGITFSTKQYRFKGYMDKLRSRIEGIWVYPREAIEKGIYGDLELRFTINRDGTLKGRPELVRTSGYRMLDEAAIKALKEGEPYWPLPEEWGMDTYTIKGHFIYGLYGRQLR